MKKVLEERLNVLVLVVMAIFVTFTLKLVQYQLIDGEMYYSKSNATTRINQKVTAARGDITDINGVPLAGGQVVFDVTVNKAYMPADKLNERLLETVKILQQQGEAINDILPMEKEYPYSFLTEKATELTRLREDVAGVAIYATEQDVLAKLTERYKLQATASTTWNLYDYKGGFVE